MHITVHTIARYNDNNANNASSHKHKVVTYVNEDIMSIVSLSKAVKR